MLRLLTRDLRLHPLLLGTPLGVTLLLSWPFCAADTGGRMAAAGLAFFLALLLPLSFHLREQSEGTLADVAALPVTRARIVGLRYLEAILLPLGAVLLLVLAACVLHLLGLRPGTGLGGFPRAFLSHPVGLGWTFFLGFAYPLPATLRWGGKGLGIAVAIPLLALFGVAQCAMRVSQGSLAGRGVLAVVRAFLWMGGQPGLEALLLLCLLALSFALSLRAFAAKDL